MFSRWRQVKEWAGVTLLDAPRYWRALYAPWRRPDAWTRLSNRIERLTEHPAGLGVRCEWKWGSYLHAPTVYPSWGRRLMKVALTQWPIRFADSPASTARPKVSFLFAHAGQDRVPQLLQTLKSVFAQRDVQVECIVVDQSETSIGPLMPPAVTFAHLEKRGRERGWHKSWAYNIAARMATGTILVFLDGDICVPDRYAAELVRTIHERKYQAVSLQRFLFYVDEPSTKSIERVDGFPNDVQVLHAYQNWKGGTIALEREAFLGIGGFDEGFVNWGGEDDEFYDRCRLLRHWQYGYLPFVHLWHVPQSERLNPSNVNEHVVLPARLAIPADERRQELRARSFGELTGPDPRISYASLAGGTTSTP